MPPPLRAAGVSSEGKRLFLHKNPWSFLCLQEGPHQTDDTSMKQKEEGGNCLIAWSVLKPWTSS